MIKFEAILLTTIFGLISFPFFLVSAIFLSFFDLFFLVSEMLSDKNQFEHGLMTKTMKGWVKCCKYTYNKILENYV